MTTLVEICGLPLVHALGWTLLHLCWQGTVVAVVLWCVLGVLGGRSSRARYAAACLALGLMIALPLATFAHLASAEYRMRAAFDGPAVAIGPGMVVRVGAGELTVPWPERIAVALDQALPWMMMAWFAGVVLFVARLNVGLMVARRMRLVATTAVPAELQQAFDALRRRLGVARAVRLMHSALVQAPTVIGWLRPVVLIPASCLTGLSTMQIEAVLAHELAHIRRHDYLVSVMQSVIETLLFYHPAVWWVSRQVRQERECCCDEMAVAVGGDRLAYARALSVLAERRSYSPEFVLGANGGVLMMRIKRLLGRTEGSAATQLASIALLAALVVAAGATAGKLAHAQSGAAQTGSSTAQAAAVDAAQEPSDAPHPLLSTAGQQTDTEIKQRLQDSSAATQDYSAALQDSSAAMQQMNGNLAQFDKVSPEVQKQMEDAQRQLQNAQRQLRDAQKKLNNEQFKKHMEDAQRQLQDAQKKLNNEQFKKQMADAIAKAARVNSPEFKKQLDDAMKAMEKVNTPEYSKKMEELLAQNAAVQEPGAPSVPVTPPAPVPIVRLPQAAPGGQVRVSAAVVAGMSLSKIDPVYPAEAKEKHVQGAVIMHATISKTGTMENLTVISGPEELRQSAIDAVSKWTYKPYLLNGQPMEVETSITVNYSLAGSAQVRVMAGDATDGVKQIGGDVKGPIPIYQPEPDYTQAGRKAKVQGVVTVSLVVDAHGQPQNVHIVHGLGIGPDGKPDPKFKKAWRKAANGMNQSAVDAVKQYKFKPAMENGKPVAVYLNVEVNFEIF